MSTELNPAASLELTQERTQSYAAEIVIARFTQELSRSTHGMNQRLVGFFTIGTRMGKNISTNFQSLGLSPEFEDHHVFYA